MSVLLLLYSEISEKGIVEMAANLFRKKILKLLSKFQEFDFYRLIIWGTYIMLYKIYYVTAVYQSFKYNIYLFY